MAIDFPDSPTDGQIFTSGSRSWEYNATKGIWQSSSSLTATNLSALDSSIVPDANVTYDLGSSENAFRDLYLAGNTLFLGSASITSDESGKLTLPEGTLIGAEFSVSNTEFQTVLANTNSYIASVDNAKLETTDVDYSISLTQQGTLAVTTGTARWYAPYNLATNSIKSYVETAPVGSAINITVNKNGTSAATPSISAGATTSTEITSPITMSEGDYLTVDINSVGSTTAGENLNIVFKYKRT